MKGCSNLPYRNYGSHKRRSLLFFTILSSWISSRCCCQKRKSKASMSTWTWSSFCCRTHHPYMFWLLPWLSALYLLPISLWNNVINTFPTTCSSSSDPLSAQRKPHVSFFMYLCLSSSIWHCPSTSLFRVWMNVLLANDLGWFMALSLLKHHTMEPRLVSNLYLSCFRLSSSEITGVHHQARPSSFNHIISSVVRSSLLLPLRVHSTSMWSFVCSHSP